MKRILALFLALIMLFALTACGEDETSTSASESTGATTSTTEGTNDPTDGTQATIDVTEPATTPTDSTTATENTQASGATNPTESTNPSGAHQHSYTSKVTKAATCTAKGVTTYTCSCGDSYTKDIKATGHAWGEWKTTKEPTVAKEGKAQRKCSTCSTTENKTLDKLSLPFDENFNGGNALTVSCLNGGGMSAEGMLNFCSWEIFHSYIYEKALTPLAQKHKITVGQKDFYFTQYAVPEDVVLSIIEKRFILMEDFWYDLLRSSDRYDSQTQTFLCTEPVWFTGIDATVVAYEHMGGNDYTLYLESRIVDHPGAPCSECATTDSCVLDRTRISATIWARAGSPIMVISYGIVNTIPSSATPMN